MGPNGWVHRIGWKESKHIRIFPAVPSSFFSAVCDSAKSKALRISLPVVI